MAAAISEFRLNSPGATGMICTETDGPVLTATVAGQRAVPARTSKLIWLGETKSKPAGRLTEAESTT